MRRALFRKTKRITASFLAVCILAMAVFPYGNISYANSDAQPPALEGDAIVKTAQGTISVVDEPKTGSELNKGSATSSSLETSTEPEKESVTSSSLEVSTEAEKEPVTSSSPEVSTEAEKEPVTSSSPEASTEAEKEPVTSSSPEASTEAEKEPVISSSPEASTEAEKEPVISSSPETSTEAEKEPVTSSSPETSTEAEKELVTSSSPETSTEAEKEPATSSSPEVSIEPTATPVASPEASIEPTATPVASPEASIEPTATPAVNPEASIEPTATPAVNPEASIKPTATPAANPEASIEPTATPAVNPEASIEPTATPVASPEASVEPTATPVASPEISIEPIETPVVSPESTTNNSELSMPPMMMTKPMMMFAAAPQSSYGVEVINLRKNGTLIDVDGLAAGGTNIYAKPGDSIEIKFKPVGFSNLIVKVGGINVISTQDSQESTTYTATRVLNEDDDVEVVFKFYDGTVYSNFEYNTKIIYDKTVPTITATSRAGEANTNKSILSITPNDDKEISKIYMSVNQNETKPWSTECTPPAGWLKGETFDVEVNVAGTYYFYVVDKAGNESSIANAEVEQNKYEVIVKKRPNGNKDYVKGEEFTLDNGYLKFVRTFDEVVCNHAPQCQKICLREDECTCCTKDANGVCIVGPSCTNYDYVCALVPMNIGTDGETKVSIISPISNQTASIGEVEIKLKCILLNPYTDKEETYYPSFKINVVKDSTYSVNFVTGSQQLELPEDETITDDTELARIKVETTGLANDIQYAWSSDPNSTGSEIYTAIFDSDIDEVFKYDETDNDWHWDDENAMYRSGFYVPGSEIVSTKTITINTQEIGSEDKSGTISFEYKTDAISENILNIDIVGDNTHSITASGRNDWRKYTGYFTSTDGIFKIDLSFTSRADLQAFYGNYGAIRNLTFEGQKAWKNLTGDTVVLKDGDIVGKDNYLYIKGTNTTTGKTIISRSESFIYPVELIGIEINTVPNQTLYDVGIGKTAVNTAGGKITLIYNKGKEKIDIPSNSVLSYRYSTVFDNTSGKYVQMRIFEPASQGSAEQSHIDLTKPGVRDIKVVYDDFEDYYTVTVNYTADNIPTSDDRVKVNAPKIVDGMIPVKWVEVDRDEDGVTEEGFWLTTTIYDTEWYNYNPPGKSDDSISLANSRKWANVMLKDGIKIREVENPKDPSNALSNLAGKRVDAPGSAFVWIPRFSYQYNSSKQNFDISWSEGTNDTSGCTKQSAFTYGNKELTGFWIAKYEASDEKGGEIEIKADKASSFSGSNFTVADAYEISKEMLKDNKEQYGISSNITSHLVTMAEWDAVTMLANSDKNYGAKPRQNTKKDGGSKTGYSGNTFVEFNSQASSSTTYNMHGIFDMFGGAHEFVSAFISYEEGAYDEWDWNFMAMYASTDSSIYGRNSRNSGEIDIEEVKYPAYDANISDEENVQGPINNMNNWLLPQVLVPSWAMYGMYEGTALNANVNMYFPFEAVLKGNSFISDTSSNGMFTTWIVPHDYFVQSGGSEAAGFRPTILITAPQTAKDLRVDATLEVYKGGVFTTDTEAGVGDVIRLTLTPSSGLMYIKDVVVSGTNGTVTYRNSEGATPNNTLDPNHSGNQWIIEYTVGAGDNGQFTFSYSYKIQGEDATYIPVPTNDDGDVYMKTGGESGDDSGDSDPDDPDNPNPNPDPSIPSEPSEPGAGVTIEDILEIYQDGVKTGNTIAGIGDVIRLTLRPSSGLMYIKDVVVSGTNGTITYRNSEVETPSQELDTAHSGTEWIIEYTVAKNDNGQFTFSYSYKIQDKDTEFTEVPTNTSGNKYMDTTDPVVHATVNDAGEKTIVDVSIEDFSPIVTKMWTKENPANKPNPDDFEAYYKAYFENPPLNSNPINIFEGTSFDAEGEGTYIVYAKDEARNVGISSDTVEKKPELELEALDIWVDSGTGYTKVTPEYIAINKAIKKGASIKVNMTFSELVDTKPNVSILESNVPVKKADSNFNEMAGEGGSYYWTASWTTDKYGSNINAYEDLPITIKGHAFGEIKGRELNEKFDDADGIVIPYDGSLVNVKLSSDHTQIYHEVGGVLVPVQNANDLEAGNKIYIEYEVEFSAPVKVRDEDGNLIVSGSNLDLNRIDLMASDITITSGMSVQSIDISGSNEKRMIRFNDVQGQDNFGFSIKGIYDTVMDFSSITDDDCVARDIYGSPNKYFETTAGEDTPFIDTVKPVVENVVITSTDGVTKDRYAKDGDTVIITFKVTETLAQDPIVTIFGQNVYDLTYLDGVYTAKYTIPNETHTEGFIPFTIEGCLDPRGNVAVTITQDDLTDEDKVIYDRTVPVINFVPNDGTKDTTTLEITFTDNKAGVSPVSGIANNILEYIWCESNMVPASPMWNTKAITEGNNVFIEIPKGISETRYLIINSLTDKSGNSNQVFISDQLPIITVQSILTNNVSNSTIANNGTTITINMLSNKKLAYKPVVTINCGSDVRTIDPNNIVDVDGNGISWRATYTIPTDEMTWADDTVLGYEISKYICVSGYNGIVITKANSEIRYKRHYKVNLTASSGTVVDDSDPGNIITTLGTLGGGGNYIAGEQVTIIATPEEGYRFDKWDIIGVSGFTDLRLAEQSFSMPNNNVEGIASFIKTWKVKVVPDPGDETTATEQTVDHGKAAVLPPKPTKEGYDFIGWQVVPENADYTNVTCDMEIIAKFQRIEHKIIIDIGDGGNVRNSSGANLAPPQRVEVTVYEGENKRFNIAPNNGYRIKDVKVDGESKGPINTYLFTNVNKDHDFEVIFEEEPRYTLEGEWYYDNIELVVDNPEFVFRSRSTIEEYEDSSSIIVIETTIGVDVSFDYILNSRDDAMFGFTLNGEPFRVIESSDEWETFDERIYPVNGKIIIGLTYSKGEDLTGTETVLDLAAIKNLVVE